MRARVEKVDVLGWNNSYVAGIVPEAVGLMDTPRSIHEEARDNEVASVDVILEGKHKYTEHVRNERRLSSRLCVQLDLDQEDARKAADMAHQTVMLQLQSCHDSSLRQVKNKFSVSWNQIDKERVMWQVLAK